MDESQIPYAMRGHPSYAGDDTPYGQHEPPQELDPAVGTWLREILPLRNPTVGATMAEVQREAGRQEVVDLVFQALLYLETRELCADQPPP